MKKITKKILTTPDVFIINATEGKSTLAGTADNWYAGKFLGLFIECEPTKEQRVAIVKKINAKEVAYEAAFKLFGASFNEISLTINQVIDFCDNNKDYLLEITGFLCKTPYGFYAIYINKYLSTYYFHLRTLDEISCVTNFVIPIILD